MKLKNTYIWTASAKCLKAKRYAMRDKKPADRVIYKCIKSKANTEIYMGEKKILSLILE
jgi:hypothetical protein